MALFSKLGFSPEKARIHPAPPLQLQKSENRPHITIADHLWKVNGWAAGWDCMFWRSELFWCDEIAVAWVALKMWHVIHWNWIENGSVIEIVSKLRFMLWLLSTFYSLMSFEWRLQPKIPRHALILFCLCASDYKQIYLFDMPHMSYVLS